MAIKIKDAKIFIALFKKFYVKDYKFIGSINECNCDDRAVVIFGNHGPFNGWFPPALLLLDGMNNIGMGEKRIGLFFQTFLTKYKIIPFYNQSLKLIGQSSNLFKNRKELTQSIKNKEYDVYSTLPEGANSVIYSKHYVKPFINVGMIKCAVEANAKILLFACSGTENYGVNIRLPLAGFFNKDTKGITLNSWHPFKRKETFVVNILHYENPIIADIRKQSDRRKIGYMYEELFFDMRLTMLKMYDTAKDAAK